MFKPVFHLSKFREPKSFTVILSIINPQMIDTLLILLVFCMFGNNSKYATILICLIVQNILLLDTYWIMLPICLIMYYLSTKFINVPNEYTLYFSLLVSCYILVYSCNIVHIIIGLTLFSISSYSLSKSDLEIEQRASINYMIVSVMASLLILIGISISYVYVTLSSCIILLGFVLKMSAYPLAWWTLTVYEQIHKRIGLLLLFLPKLVLAVPLFRYINYLSCNDIIYPIMLTIILCLLIGSITGYKEFNVIRLLALSGSTQLGYLFLPLMYNNLESLELYILFYTITILISIILLQLSEYNPVINVVGIANNASLPPFVGFLAKIVISTYLFLYIAQLPSLIIHICIFLSSLVSFILYFTLAEYIIPNIPKPVAITSIQSFYNSKSYNFILNSQVALVLICLLSIPILFII